jgi:hypothetical protein
MLENCQYNGHKFSKRILRNFQQLNAVSLKNVLSNYPYNSNSSRGTVPKITNLIDPAVAKEYWEITNPISRVTVIDDPGFDFWQEQKNFCLF